MFFKIEILLIGKKNVDFFDRNKNYRIFFYSPIKKILFVENKLEDLKKKRFFSFTETSNRKFITIFLTKFFNLL